MGTGFYKHGQSLSELKTRNNCLFMQKFKKEIQVDAFRSNSYADKINKVGMPFLHIVGKRVTQI